MAYQQTIASLEALDYRLEQYLSFSRLAGPDGDVHPGIRANIREAIDALETGKVPAPRVASGLKKMAEYCETIGITRDAMMAQYLYDLKIIADGIVPEEANARFAPAVAPVRPATTARPPAAEPAPSRASSAPSPTFVFSREGLNAIGIALGCLLYP